jgi:hypothetical protein
VQIVGAGAARTRLDGRLVLRGYALSEEGANSDTRAAFDTARPLAAGFSGLALRHISGEGRKLSLAGSYMGEVTRRPRLHAAAAVHAAPVRAPLFADCDRQGRSVALLGVQAGVLRSPAAVRGGQSRRPAARVPRRRDIRAAAVEQRGVRVRLGALRAAHLRGSPLPRTAPLVRPDRAGARRACATPAGAVWPAGAQQLLTGLVPGLVPGLIPGLVPAAAAHRRQALHADRGGSGGPCSRVLPHARAASRAPPPSAFCVSARARLTHRRARPRFLAAGETPGRTPGKDGTPGLGARMQSQRFLASTGPLPQTADEPPAVSSAACVVRARADCATRRRGF